MVDDADEPAMAQQARDAAASAQPGFKSAPAGTMTKTNTATGDSETETMWAHKIPQAMFRESRQYGGSKKKGSGW